MACERIPSLTFAFPIVAGVFIADDADAAADVAFSATAAPCYYDPAPTSGYGDVGGIGYYCDGVQSLDNLEGRNADQIPIDGVLVLQATFKGAWGQPIADRATVTVTQNDVPVDGALELTQAPGLLAWRPAAAWTAGVYQFRADIANPGLTPECGLDQLTVEFPITVASDPSAPLTPSTLSGVETLSVVPQISLETLACCPGVAPTVNMDMCSGSQSVQFDPEQCTPLSADGTLLVDLTGTASGSGSAELQLLYELTVDGASYAVSPTPVFSVALQKPFCAIVHTHDLASGDTVDGPMACFGNDVADQLGVHDIPPPDSFTCSLRTCDVAGNTWDLDACTPLDPNHPNEPEPDDKACDCTTDDAGGPAALALTAAVGLALRRRRRR